MNLKRKKERKYQHLYLIEKSSKPKFQIDLSIAIFNIHINKGNKMIPQGKEKLCFEIFYDKVYTFCCPSQIEFDEWMSTLPLLTKVYGTFKYPLGCAVSKSGWRYPIPIYRGIEYLQKNKGSEVEGIFRTSASYKIVGRVKSILDGDQDIAIEEFKECACAAAIIKEYLRELPDPLIPFQYYNEFVIIGRLKEGTKEKEAKKLINKLPDVNKNTLWYLCYFCQEVVKNVEKTQMNANNLGTCLGPTICRAPPQEAMKEMENTKLVIEGFATLINYYKEIFKEIEDLNLRAGINPPNYPAVVPHPAAPYEKVTEEIQKVVIERQKRINAGKPRQTIFSHKTNKAEVIDGTNLVKEQVQKVMSQNNVLTSPTIQTSKPNYLPPKPNRLQYKTNELIGGNSANSVLTAIIDKEEDKKQEIIKEEIQEYKKINNNNKEIIEKTEINNNKEEIEEKLPTLPPPRRKTNYFKENTGEIINKILEQEKEIEELKNIIQKLENRISKQEEIIETFIQYNNQYYQEYGTGYEEGYYEGHE
ncbi:Rho GTPase-activating protein, putative [Entamoeba dispar SAW760]|uniref:Rho GTPase-activating protein, putative n=1 Tax=Entamoeba dispar (strain ATCC PRA-260 / SAW760) TaxID=370354 RepID=B0E8Q6_ENTDS|nr:Rho GTPase-activating protein, putative [Entamoeba dispar SAW760]EDR29092.1 Rho GTPase-activating protein, putative [Entamoeba dispar SAW760]|eukprot:EDR29092.1 Rho GTPase-activating protein, putative [Entamoeba dispar SAW760]